MKRNCLVPLFILFSAVKLQAQSHFISSFSPTSGPVGTTVIINGAGFNPVADSNKVLFGHLKARIVNSSETSLTAIVPDKATYNNITIISSKWTVIGGQPVMDNFATVSDLPFDVMFDDDSIISPNAFNIQNTIYDTTYPGVGGSVTYIGDFDGDEKLDFAAGKAKFQNLSVDTPAFGHPVYMPSILHTNSYPYDIYIDGSFLGCGDLDENGLPDLYVNARDIGSDFSLGYLSIPGDFDSVKTGGGGSFAAYQSDAFFPDLDNDGHADAVFFGTTTVGPNSGSGLNVISNYGYFYRPAADYYTYYCADLDGNGYKDVAGGFDWATYHVEPGIEFIKNRLPNSQTFTNLGNISDITFTHPTSNRPYAIKGGDFNGDGKVDLLIGISGRGVSLLINSSRPDTISFQPQILLSNVGSLVNINDINGDGKPDIIGNGYIYKNTSTGNNISFAAGVVCPNGIIGDFDADGKNDFLVLNGNKRSVFRHNPISNRTLCPGANLVITTPANGTTFQWQLNTGSGFSNIADNAVYAGANTAALQLSNIPSSYYGYEYRCLVGNNPSGQFKITFENKWTGAVSSAWKILPIGVVV